MNQPSKSDPQGTRQILKSTAAFGSATVVSRITGLFRDIVFAQVMGSTYVADAFFVAFRIPNFFRRIFGEGAFSAAFVPVYTQQRIAGSNTEVQAFVNIVATRLSIVLLALALLGVILAPWIVAALAPGFSADAVKYQLTIDSLRILFPYVFFVCLVALSAAILNTHGQFAAPAATPILLNVALIASALWLVDFTENAAIALAVGVIGAGVVQLLFQVPFLVRIRTVPRPLVYRQRRGAAEAGAKEVYRLMLPSIFGASVAQINLIINTFIASFLVTGSVSWLYYSDRLMEFPLGVFGVALGSVILPRLSQEHARTNLRQFSKLLDWALRWTVLISVPATVGLAVLSEHILGAFFFYGAFTRDDVSMSATALLAFAIGLAPLVAVRVLSPGFFARNDTKTPVRAGVIAMAVNAIAAMGLVFPLQHVGLALAISIAAFVNASLLLYWLIQAKVYTVQAGWPAFTLRVVIAASIMGLALVWLLPDTDQWLALHSVRRVLQLFGYIAAGAAVYALCLLGSGMKVRQLMNA